MFTEQTKIMVKSKLFILYRAVQELWTAGDQTCREPRMSLLYLKAPVNLLDRPDKNNHTKFKDESKSTTKMNSIVEEDDKLTSVFVVFDNS